MACHEFTDHHGERKKERNQERDRGRESNSVEIYYFRGEIVTHPIRSLSACKYYKIVFGVNCAGKCLPGKIQIQSKLFTYSIPPLIPNVLPQLNPSQPHHSIKVPSITLVSEPGLLFFIVLSNVPILGPSIMAATSPATPPTTCTAEHPVRMIYI